METKMYLVRANGSGVWAGEIKERNGDTVTMTNARRLWYWSGAASLSQLAQEGVKRPQDCKFPCMVDEVIIFNVLEISKITDSAWESIKSTPIWEV